MFFVRKKNTEEIGKGAAAFSHRCLNFVLITATSIASKHFSFTFCSYQICMLPLHRIPTLLQLHLIHYFFVLNQTKTFLLLSAETINTVIQKKKKDLSFHVGPEERFSRSFKKSSWMEERALFFLGTKNTEQFTRKRCCITLIHARKDRSLNITRKPPQKYPPEAKKVKHQTRRCHR